MIIFDWMKVYMAPDAGGQGGAVVNTTTGTANAYTGTTTTSTAMEPSMKVFYDTALLENTRDKLYFNQLGRKYTLPAHHGMTVEWRKWNTIPDMQVLTEGVIPTGRTLGMTKITATITQYGDYSTISDKLELHAVDDAILGATEEHGAAAARTMEKCTRNVLSAGSNVIFADAYKAGAYVSTPTTRAALKTAIGTSGNVCYLTADMIAKAATQLRKKGAEHHTGNRYVAVIHPSVSYDLRKDPAWISAHQYSATEEIFNGEIGELHGVRFIESTLAPIIDDGGTLIYQTMVFGKDAFGVVDPAGAGLETIVKDKSQVGGPLEQFSTVGCKAEHAAAILYQERMVIIESGCSYAASDAAN